MKCFFIMLLIPVSGFSQNKNSGFASIGATALIKSSSTIGAAFAVGTGLTKNSTFGLGCEIYKFKGTNSPYIPLFAHIKVYVNEHTVRPYLTLAPGYALYSGGRTKGGGYFAASIGAHFRDLKKNSNLGLYLQAGVKFITFSTRTGLLGLTPTGMSTTTDKFFSLDLGIRI